MDKELELYLPPKKAKAADESISSFSEVIRNVPTPWEKGDIITFPNTIKGNSFKTKIGSKKFEYIVVHVKKADGSEHYANFFPSLFRRRVRKCYREQTKDGVDVAIPTDDFVVTGGSIVDKLFTKLSKMNDVVKAILGKSIRISEVDHVLSQGFGTTYPELVKVYDFEPEGWTIRDAPVDTPEDTTTAPDTIKEIENTYGNGVGNGQHNGHEWVDLGLSVKWATCNVGASYPCEDGDLFAWGETETKETYDYSNSLTYGLGIPTLQSLCFIDSKCNLTSSYDAATANWGGRWRMPTESEMEELVDNCTWEWIIRDCGICCEVTGPNGNSIILPADSMDSYWSSTPYDDYYGDGEQAYDLWVGSVNPYGSHFVDYHEPRSFGKYVRPVLD